MLGFSCSLCHHRSDFKGHFHTRIVQDSGSIRAGLEKISDCYLVWVGLTKQLTILGTIAQNKLTQSNDTVTEPSSFTLLANSSLPMFRSRLNTRIWGLTRQQPTCLSQKQTREQHQALQVDLSFHVKSDPELGSALTYPPKLELSTRWNWVWIIQLWCKSTLASLYSYSILPDRALI